MNMIAMANATAAIEMLVRREKVQVNGGSSFAALGFYRVRLSAAAFLSNSSSVGA